MNDIILLLSAVNICPNGSVKYVYDQSSLDMDKLNISRVGDTADTVKELMSPSSSELTSEDSVVLKLQLTPTGRKSNVLISLQAMHALSVIFEADDQSVSPITVNTISKKL